MTQTIVKVPFVDLFSQHQPLAVEIEQAIGQVIKRGDFVLGQAVTEFESAFAKACGVEYAVGVASGTEAIALGLQACGIGQGDEVIVPVNTFIATVVGVLRAGATPILVDCDRDTALLDLNAAAAAVTLQTKAVVPVHLYGQMVSPPELLNFAQTHNLLILEDAAQAHLANRETYIAGGIGKVAAFSFYPSKNLGAFGNGGIVVTQDAEIAKTLKSLRNYGAPQKYLHTQIGTNSRLDTIQAAVLKVKLLHLQQWNQQRNYAATYYDRCLKPLVDRGIIPIRNDSGSGHVYHLYVIRVTKDCPLSRDEIQQQLAAKGIQTGIHYPLPCHRQPAYRFLGYQKGDFPQAETLAEQILSLPMYPGLGDLQIEYVVEQLNSLLSI